MSLNIISFLLFYFLIISSTIGYGYLMVQITGINKICFNHSYLGIIGIFSLIFLSYISHYIFAHSYYFNSIVLLIGLTSSFNIIAIGLVGEYVSRIYTEVKNRPSYIISETYDQNSSIK